MGNLKIHCIVCGSDDHVDEDRVALNRSYRCPKCGIPMSDYQWTMLRGTFYTGEAATMKMQNPVDVKLFLCEYVFDLSNLDTGGCKL